MPNTSPRKPSADPGTPASGDSPRASAPGGSSLLDPRWARSREAAARLRSLVPGGAHTYAKGPDQYPADCAPSIARGKGARVWDVAYW